MKRTRRVFGMRRVKLGDETYLIRMERNRIITRRLMKYKEFGRWDKVKKPPEITLSLPDVVTCILRDGAAK